MKAWEACRWCPRAFWSSWWREAHEATCPERKAVAASMARHPSAAS